MDENRIADGDFSCSNRRINIITLTIGFLILNDCGRAGTSQSPSHQEQIISNYNGLINKFHEDFDFKGNVISISIGLMDLSPHHLEIPLGTFVVGSLDFCGSLAVDATITEAGTNLRQIQITSKKQKLNFF